jgi:hypothetical protein
MTPEQQIEKVKDKIKKIGPLLPGSISEQWNVCGTPGCVCKDSKHPKKHGPYFQLSYSIKGRSSTMFLKKEDVVEARRRIRHYREFKKLSFKLVNACVDLARKNGLKKGKT